MNFTDVNLSFESTVVDYKFSFCFELNSQFVNLSSGGQSPFKAEHELTESVSETDF